jgi:hypothetical protein
LANDETIIGGGPTGLPMSADEAVAILERKRGGMSMTKLRDELVAEQRRREGRGAGTPGGRGRRPANRESVVGVAE